MASLQDLSGLSETLKTTFILFLVILIVGSLIALIIFLVNNKKKYTYLCYIIENAGSDNIVMSRDDGGVFVDKKTGNKRFFLKKNNVGLDPDKVPWILSPKGIPVVFLEKDGLKNFKYIDFRLYNDGQPADIFVGEEDVNWALNSYARAKNLFNNSLLQTLMPYLGMLIMGIMIIIMLVLLFQKFEVLNHVATSLERASSNLAQANSGTVVVPT